MSICEHCLHERLCKAEKGVMRCMSFESAWYPAEKAVEVFGAERQKLVAIGEMGELMTAISDHERGRKTVQDIADEIADVEQVLEELKIIYGIKRDVLLAKPRKATKLAFEIVKELEKRDAVHNKTVRLAHRLAEEDVAVRNSNILDEVPSVLDALEMCSSDKCSDKCRYYGRPECCGGLMEDAAVLIEELSARNGGGSK